MLGRGIDQVQRHPGKPELRESYIKGARGYVELAERDHGPVPRAVEPAYVWGDAIGELDRMRPAASIINLETSITVSDDFWPDKEVHYRMNPENIACLTVARVDVCALANNHLLDFGRSGLTETLKVLRSAGIACAGAGATLEEARRPARIVTKDGVGLQVAAFGSESSGIPPDWAAGPLRSGVDLLPDLSAKTAHEIGKRLRAGKRPGDILVASVHWGNNWGYQISREQVEFAHRLIDGGVDVVHGHSSHHVRPVEVYEHKLILYGCGDLLTDYEGIRSHEAWRGDLGAMYFASLSAHDGTLRGLRLVPTQVRGLQIKRSSGDDTLWLRDTLNRISAQFGTRFVLGPDGLLVLHHAQVA